MIDYIKNYVFFNKDTASKFSYGVILLLLMVIGILYANMTYYKNSAIKLSGLSQTVIDGLSIASAKVKVLETYYFDKDEDFSIYEKGFAKNYNDKHVVLQRVKGVRKNIIFINYLSYVDLKPDYVELIAGAFYDAALKYDMDSRELIATAWHESRFIPTSLSRVGATGVMQIMELWLKNDDFIFENDIYCKEDLIDPVKNINAGAYIYNHYKNYWKRRGYKKDFNVRRLALLSYNRGKGRVSKLMRDGINPANGYFKVITKKYNKLKKLEEKMI